MQRKGLNSSRKNRKVKRSDAIERSSKIKPEKGAGALVTWMSLVIEQERILEHKFVEEAKATLGGVEK